MTYKTYLCKLPKLPKLIFYLFIKYKVKLIPNPLDFSNICIWEKFLAFWDRFSSSQGDEESIKEYNNFAVSNLMVFRSSQSLFHVNHCLLIQLNFSTLFLILKRDYLFTHH